MKNSPTRTINAIPIIFKEVKIEENISLILTPNILITVTNMMIDMAVKRSLTGVNTFNYPANVKAKPAIEPVLMIKILLHP